MRTGYTTGACAAAAAKAATIALLSGEPVREVTIRLPIGEDATFQIHSCEIDGGDNIVCQRTLLGYQGWRRRSGCYIGRGDMREGMARRQY